MVELGDLSPSVAPRPSKGGEKKKVCEEGGRYRWTRLDRCHDRYWLPNLFDHYLHALVYISAVRTRPDGIHILGSKLDLRIELK